MTVPQISYSLFLKNITSCYGKVERTGSEIWTIGDGLSIEELIKEVTDWMNHTDEEVLNWYRLRCGWLTRLSDNLWGDFT